MDVKEKTIEGTNVHIRRYTQVCVCVCVFRVVAERGDKKDLLNNLVGKKKKKKKDVHI